MSHLRLSAFAMLVVCFGAVQPALAQLSSEEEVELGTLACDPAEEFLEPTRYLQAMRY